LRGSKRAAKTRAAALRPGLFRGSRRSPRAVFVFVSPAYGMDSRHEVCIAGQEPGPAGRSTPLRSPPLRGASGRNGPLRRLWPLWDIYAASFGASFARTSVR